jgi:hypothetical protein
MKLHLEASLSEGEAVVTENCKFILENCDLYQCQQDNPVLCEQLFDVLEQICLSQENIKWLFQLHRKSTKKSIQKHSQSLVSKELKSSDSAVKCIDDSLEKSSDDEGDIIKKDELGRSDASNYVTDIQIPLS